MYVSTENINDAHINLLVRRRGDTPWIAGNYIFLQVKTCSNMDDIKRRKESRSSINHVNMTDSTVPEVEHHQRVENPYSILISSYCNSNSNYISIEFRTDNNIRGRLDDVESKTILKKLRNCALKLKVYDLIIVTKDFKGSLYDRVYNYIHNHIHCARDCAIGILHLNAVPSILFIH